MSMFTQPSSLSSQVVLGMAAAAGERSSSYRNHSGPDLLGSMSPATSAFHSSGEDLTEEDVWFVGDADVQPSEPVSRVSLHTTEQSFSGLRLTNRGRPDALSAASSGFGVNVGPGLSLLSADLRSAGQGPGGDILKANGVAPVVIPAMASNIDHVKSRLSGGHHRASAPVNVPDWSKITGGSHQPRRWAVNDDENSDEEEDDKMVPPHEDGKGLLLRSMFLIGAK
eukprot:TRINITY_DN2861_c0_g1_i1.p1 TRINITY_DN2861_c0_g1~~TRINITY_DN2861_c0_g1_i1.p1  ORF type:complete len:225 (-),score=6.68 TRINITY_DN2861_c0_g1_i1:793-1467(-)